MGKRVIDQPALLEQWQKTRSPRIADVLQTVPVDDEWTERLAAIKRVEHGSAKRRIDRLPDDPRVTVFLMECVRDAKWPGAGANNLWTAIFKRLVALKDRRAIAPLRAAVAAPPYFQGAAFTKKLVKKIGETADALEKACAKLPRDDAKPDLKATIPAGGWFAKKQGVTNDVEKLIRDVWANPDDMALRSVVADVLLEQEDPWGELISLQIAKSSERERSPRRIKQLVHKLASRICGPIAQVSTRMHMRFEAGFIAECGLDKAMVGRRRWEDAALAPQWSTVHTVHIWSEMPVWFPTKWLTNPALATLRKVVLFGNTILERADASASWRMTSAARLVGHGTKRCLKAFVGALPKTEVARIVWPKPPSNQMRELIATYSAS